MKVAITIRQVAAVAVGVAAVGVGGTAIAAPASATVTPKVNCSWKPSHNSDFGNASFSTSGVNIRSGPSTACTVLGSGYTSQHIYLRCATTTSGVEWDYLTDTTTGVTGWADDAYISWGGAGGDVAAC